MQRDPRTFSLTRLSDVRTLIHDLGMHPSRALGQNFLVDRNILDILLGAADVRVGQWVLEIGPGLGVLTEALLAHGAQVVAVEKDHRLFAYLADALGDTDRLTLLEGDVLDIGIPRLLERGFDSVVANLPYSPGSRILLDLVRDPHAPPEITVTVQLEVAQRITAEAGAKTFGLMGLWCQLHYHVALIKSISSTCFWPRPDVKSAIVTLRRRRTSPLQPAHAAHFYAMTRYAFQHRRKQLASSLPKGPPSVALAAERTRTLLESVGAPADARPEALDVKRWCAFVEATV